MKLKFKKQQYQEDAASSVVKCFEGQPSGYIKEILGKREYTINEGTMWEETIAEDIEVFRNKKIELTNDELRKNVRQVQKQNNLDYTNEKEFNNFSIEMETGTGKTYTYIKTMYELNKAYGWSKFIVIVPSIAIREGVLKSFQITQEHFQEIYHKKIRYSVYNSNNSSNIANINEFAEDMNIQVIIMNYQAFNIKSKENRRIYEELDELQTRKPIDVIKETNPILIVDEPQKMGKTEQMLKEFNPLFILRYSATHKEKFKFNMIYRLDAIDAYNQKLVKKINVKGIELLHNKTEDAYLYLENVEISKSNPIAKMEIEVKSKTGVRKHAKNFKIGDDLYKISGKLEQYKGYKITQIDATNDSFDKVSFTNGVNIKTGQVFGDEKQNAIARVQIRETIKSHFEKEIQYYKKGIKVLSLFFIDEVAKYRIYDEQKHPHNGIYAEIFEEEYNKIYQEYYDNVNEDYKQYLDFLKGKKVHNGYFSIDKKASKGLKEDEIIYIDSKIDNKEDETSWDEEAYDLIMKDKEKLLSNEEPVRFIFSHSALREGWDNPNIFQICTLKKNNSEISKRQEIGRGLRVCVNQNGDRMDYKELEDDFFEINNLTVIASESYESFAKALQDEISKSLSRKYYDILDDTLLLNKELKNSNGEVIVIDKPLYNKIYSHFLRKDYIDDEGKISQKLREDISNDCLKIPEIMEEYKQDYIRLIKHLFTDTKITLENSGKKNINILKPNSNFNIDEFRQLWNKINLKTIYEVNFDSNRLIEQSINKLNEELKISKTRIKITKGSQKDAMSVNMLAEKKAIYSYQTESEIYEDEGNILNTKYDLIGDIAKDTVLTRNTIIKILSGIKKEIFEQYQYNPEEFMIKASNLINQEKAKMTIDEITYIKTKEKYEDEIFIIKNANGRIGDNALKVERNIYDYLITDSKNEIKFAKELEKDEVKVYAKLPNSFKIQTPVGTYNPDWLVILENKFKNRYFIVETKGSTNDMQIRPIEDAKIECAKKHFKTICDDSIKYVMVDDYEKLLDIANEA